MRSAVQCDGHAAQPEVGLLDRLPPKTRRKITVNDEGCWIAPVTPRYFRVSVGESSSTVRQRLWLLSGRKKPVGGYLVSVCGHDRCVNPAHMVGPKGRSGAKARGYNLAKLSRTDVKIAALILQERGYVPAEGFKANPSAHLRIGQYRIWERTGWLSWVEPVGYSAARKAGKGELYELLTGRRR